MARQRLTRPRSEVALLLEDLIAQGRELVEEGKAIQGQFAQFATDMGFERNLEALKTWVHRLERWHAFGRDALASAYEGDEVATEFYNAARGSLRAHPTIADQIIHRIAATEGGVNTLISFTERLRFADEPVAPETPEVAVAVSNQAAETIFIVHGHDEAAKYEVAHFLERIKTPEVVILDEQADRGRTIIEKFEQHAEAAGYAVVLLTGDDEGRKRGDEELRPRARQNVILELGFFIGRLGRSQVAMLYKEGVERPSDIDGVLVLPLDADGAWKRKLAGEMSAAGVALDAEAVLRA